MKAKLKKGILKKYGLSVGGDMSENVAIAVDLDGKLLDKKEWNTTSCRIMTFHCCDDELEFLVVDHKNPMAKEQYECFSALFEEVKSPIQDLGAVSEDCPEDFLDTLNKNMFYLLE